MVFREFGWFLRVEEALSAICLAGEVPVRDLGKGRERHWRLTARRL